METRASTEVGSRAAASRRRTASRTLALAITLALVCAAVLPASAQAKEIPHFYGSASQESLLSDMTTHPAAVRSGAKTWIAFQGPGFDPYIMEWDSEARTWAGPFRIGVNALELDAHGGVSLWVDPASGRLHVFWGGHIGPIRHSVTSSAGTIASWIPLADIASRGTYKQALAMPDGTVAVYYRDSLKSAWVSRTSDPGDPTTFGPAVPILAYDADSAWYANFSLGASGKVHCAFVLQDFYAYRNGRIYSRYDVHYIYRDPDGSWHAAGGGEALPTTPAPVVPALAYKYRVFHSGSALVNEVTVREDDEGAPCILAVVQNGPAFDDFTWRWWRFASGTWRTTDITGADHFFDSATFSTGDSGTVDAALVSGTNPAAIPADGNGSGRGGIIEHWTSSDRGVSWSRGTPATISPDDPGVPFADPVLVDGAPSPDARLVFMDWTSDITDSWRRLYLWGDSGLVTRDTSGTAERLAGVDRASTAVAISKRAFPERARAVVITTQRDFPDALAGAPLAAKLGGPMLITPPTGLPPAVRSEISRLRPSKAVILGGTGVVPDVIHQQLHQLGVVTVERIAGAGRYDTMLGVSRAMLDKGNRTRTAIVVSGRSWADAAAGATLAAANRWPVLLTEPNAPTAQTRTALVEWGITRAIVVGGEGAVGATVFSGLPGAVRLGGQDRCETAAMVAEFGLREGLVADRVMLANSGSFPDALTSATLGQHLRAPLLLTPASTLATPSATYLDTHAERISAAFVAGGSAVVGEDVWATARTHARLP